MDARLPGRRIEIYELKQEGTRLKAAVELLPGHIEIGDSHVRIESQDIF